MRTHDLMMEDGSMRVMLTPEARVMTVFDVRSSPLGPLHIPVSVAPLPQMAPDLSPEVLRALRRSAESPEAMRAVRQASAETFEAMKGISRRVGPPALEITRDAASEAAERIRKMQGENVRLAHVLARAHLGDRHAKGFLQKLVRDAKAGVRGARRVANAMLEVPKFTAKVLDVPVLVASHIKGAGGIVRMLSPLERFQHMIAAVQKGDIKTLEHMIKSDLSMMQGVISLVPGIGTGFSAAVGAGLAALEGGHPLAVAIKMAYGAIPIPVGIRQVTDVVLDSVIAIIEHPHKITDAAIQIARDRVPSGLPRDVFDTLVHVVVKHVPIQKEVGALATHYVNKYAGAIAGPALDHVVKALGVNPALVQNVAANAVSLVGTGARALAARHS